MSAERLASEGHELIPLDAIGNGPLVRAKRLDFDHVTALVPYIDAVPPVVVYRDGERYRLIDGAHRLAAASRQNRDTIRAVITRVGDSDAERLARAVVANIEHGLTLTLAERKNAARQLIRLESGWSTARIATSCGLSDKTVEGLRPPAPPVSNLGNSEVGHSGPTAAPSPPSVPAPKREGADGKKRPESAMAAAAARAKAKKEAAADPGASVREIAKRAGVSPTTAAKAMSSPATEGPDADPPASGPSLTIVPDAQEGSPTVGEVTRHWPVPGQWVKEKAFRQSNDGINFARFMDRRAIRKDEIPAEIAARCPAGERANAAEAAAVIAQQWLDLSDALSTPTVMEAR